MVYTSPTKKACIVHFKNAGMTNEAIAKKFHIHQSTVSCIYHRHAKIEDYYNVKPKPGRPRKFTTLDVWFAVRTLANAKAHDITNLQRQYFPGLHAETIQQ
jgi:transposase